MKAALLHEHGSVDKLRYQEIEDPKPSKGEVLVRVRACGVNHLDIWVRQGLLGRKLQFPHICGSDIVGEIVSANKKFSTGSKVMVYPGLHCGACSYCKAGKENLCSRFAIIGGFSDVQGGYAEYVKVPMRNLVHMPNWLTFEQAACLSVSYLTVWNMLNRADVSKGKNLLVYGAGSGVGSATILLAKAKGAKVITTVGDQTKIGSAKRLGANHVINRKQNDIATEVLKLTNGVEVVFDHVGTQTWNTSLSCLKQGGKMLVCGATTGETTSIDIRTVYNKQASITGAYLGTKSQLIGLLEFMKLKKIRPLIDSTFTLSDVAKAQTRMENSEHFGKLVLQN
ncbi:MAG: zinc-binding dehydrogenase [Nitrososphaerales archaeon]